jgi:TonB family protein
MPTATQQFKTLAFDQKRNSLFQQESIIQVGDLTKEQEGSAQERLKLLSSKDNAFQIFISKGNATVVSESVDDAKAKHEGEEVNAPTVSSSASSELSALLPESGALTNEKLAEILLLGNPPNYPELAMKSNMQGSIALKISVSAYGLVTNTEVLKSTGHVLLDDEAIGAVKFWAFRTSEADKKSDNNWNYTIKFNFTIDNTPTNF